MFWRSLCAFALLVVPAFAQECNSEGDNLYITSDLLVDRTYDWWCDTHVLNQAEIRIVDGGAIYGTPRFDDGSHLVMEGGYIEAMVTESGFPWGVISGGASNSIALIDPQHESLIAGGTHNYVYAQNTRITGGAIRELTGYGGPVFLEGGVVSSVSQGFIFWSGGAIDSQVSDQTVIYVYGTNLDFTARHLTGTLADGSVLDQVFSNGDVLLVGSELLPGDTDRNGVVGLDDLNGVRNHFGENGYFRWDVDFNGSVGLSDLNLVRNNFGSSSAAVPEPATFAMLLIGIAALSNCCHRAERAGRERAGRSANPTR